VNDVFSEGSVAFIEDKELKRFSFPTLSGEVKT
jgi:hypothetical protein